MQTIARRLFRSVVPSILFTLFTGGVVLDLMIDERLDDDFGSVLRARTEAIVALTEQERGRVEIEGGASAMTSFADGDETGYFVLRAPDGTLLERSRSFATDADAAAFGVDEAHGMEARLTLPSGAPGRLMRVAFLPALDVERDDPAVNARMLALDQVREDAGSFGARLPVVLIVALDSTAHEALLRNLHWGLIGTGLMTMSVIVLLARRDIRRAIAPLQEVSRQVAGIDERRLDQRLNVDEPTVEIDTLTRRFNVLLERLHGTIERERRFAGDVAHELRTPLAEMRTLLEVSERFPDDMALHSEFHADMLGSNARMQRLVEQLLALARSEEGREMPGETVRLGALVERQLAESDSRARSRDLRLAARLPDDDAPAPGGDLWTVVVSNLIGNAVAYADPGSDVTIDLETRPEGGVRLRASNDASELEPADLEPMFERLWRKDEARTTGEHSGLGLALVRASAAQLGYTVRATLEGQRLDMIVEPV